MKKKIAVFGVKGFPAFGGASRANEEVVNILKDKYDYTIYSVSTHTDKNGIYNGCYQKVFKGYNNKRLNTLFYYLKSTFHALFFAKYDVIQINHTSSGFIVPILRLRYRVVSTARGIIPKDDNKWSKIDKFFFNLSSYLFFRFSNHVISVSEPHIEIFKKFTKKRISYIPNGVNLISLRKEPTDHNILFAAGRIISLKGGHTLLEALNIIDYDKKVIFIGSLDHTPKYKEELLRLAIDRDVDFIGLIKEKMKLFEYVNNASIFVFPSFNEGLSNMLLEVASLKTPLICSDIPENKAVFSDDEVLYFKTGDASDLASKILWAKENPSLMKKKADRAYQKLIDKFMWKDIAKKYSEIYEVL